MNKILVASCLVLAALLPASVWADAKAEARIKVFSRQLILEPNNLGARLQRALAYIDNGDMEAARADLTLAESGGNTAQADYVRGIISMREGKKQEAYAYFSTFLEVYPYHHQALDYRAQLARDLGKNEQALEDYKVLLKTSPNLGPGYYIATAKLVASVPGNGSTEALELLDQRIAQIGPVSTLQRYAIELELEQQNYSAALARLATLDEDLRRTPEWQVEVAEILIVDQRPTEARPYLEVALQQIEQLRKTPARRRLADEADWLLNSIKEKTND